jgi:hypothetical protein
MGTKNDSFAVPICCQLSVPSVLDSFVDDFRSVAVDRASADRRVVERLRVERFQKPIFLPLIFLPTCMASIPRVADSTWGQKKTHLLPPFAVSSLSRLFWILLSITSDLHDRLDDAARRFEPSIHLLRQSFKLAAMGDPRAGINLTALDHGEDARKIGALRIAAG